ncbi:pyridoxamine 5'-phosphate oxidase family protein [Aurantibacter sp.]|uniref:pyridoxamine 5'-phosphate oxidase family protein n=1 Tax=Aurantibacter sp. TaxID=2807103 RepID=UPI00326319FF
MSTKNVFKEDAKSKIKELAESIGMVMLGTNFSHQPIHVVSMSTKKVDDMGAIWFLSGKDSSHNMHIEDEARAQLFYSDPNSMEFMTVYGDAFIRTDAHILKDLYKKADDIWFNGPDDANLTAIQIKPTEGYYWDTKSNSLVALFEAGMTLLSGDKPDLGQEGAIDVG